MKLKVISTSLISVIALSSFGIANAQSVPLNPNDFKITVQGMATTFSPSQVAPILISAPSVKNSKSNHVPAIQLTKKFSYTELVVIHKALAKNKDYFKNTAMPPNHPKFSVTTANNQKLNCPVITIRKVTDGTVLSINCLPTAK